MKMSVYIDQHIGAEIFPNFPTSRHFRQDQPRAVTSRAVVRPPRL